MTTSRGSFHGAELPGELEAVLQQPEVGHECLGAYRFNLRNVGGQLVGRECGVECSAERFDSVHGGGAWYTCGLRNRREIAPRAGCSREATHGEQAFIIEHDVHEVGRPV